jgi:hypothetical protein
VELVERVDSGVSNPKDNSIFSYLSVILFSHTNFFSNNLGLDEYLEIKYVGIGYANN